MARKFPGRSIHGPRLPQPGQVLGHPTSFAFVAEPHANGVGERFSRTLKEQAIHGRVFRNVDEVGVAVTEFKDRYNRHCCLELGFMLPQKARQAYPMQKGGLSCVQTIRAGRPRM